jgi:hypothetical protein
MAKRFMLFAGSTYYPEGGWKDYIGSFDSILEATERLVQSKTYGDMLSFDWYHIVDTQLLERVK